MANINSLASILQNLTDQQLQGEMQQPSGSVPQFLVLSEMQRRQQMRAAAQQQPSGPPPQTTVAQDIVAQQAPPPEMQGVASLPQMASGPDAPGGVASFAEGGLVETRKVNPYDLEQYELESWEETKARKGYLDRVKDQVKNSLKFPEPKTEQGKKDRQAIKETVEPYVDAVKDGADRTAHAFSDIVTLPGRAVMGAANTGIRGLNAAGMDVPYIPESAFGGDSSSMTPYYDRIRRRDAAVAPGMGLDGPAGDNAGIYSVRGAEPERMQYVVETAGTADTPKKPATKPSTKKAAPVVEMESMGLDGAAGDVAGTYATRGIASLQEPEAAAAQQRSGPPNLEDPQLKTAQDYLEMVRQQNPDMIGPMIEAANKRVEETAKGRKDAANMALMRAGLGMMASKNTAFLGSVGEGGIAGLQGYSEDMRDIRRQEADARRQQDNLRLSQAEAARGNFRTAAELANAANRDALTLHGHKRQERRDDIQMNHQERLANLQAERMDRDMAMRERQHADEMSYKNRNLSADIDYKNRNLKSEDAYRRGIVAARASGGEGGGAKLTKSASVEFGKLRTALMRAEPMMPGDDPNEYMARINQMAMMQLSPEYQQALGGAYNTGAMASSGQKVLKLGKDGFYE